MELGLYFYPDWHRNCEARAGKCEILKRGLLRDSGSDTRLAGQRKPLFQDPQ